jgi:hypothetical protein
MSNAETTQTEATTNLESHPLVRSLFDLVVPLLADENNPKTLTPANSYTLDVFDTVSPLLQSFNLLERSQNFATLIPSTKYLQALNINRHDWIEYQISTYLIAFATVGDEALLLVNSVFCLGVDPKHCRSDILMNNKWVKETTIPERLDAIEKAIKPHRNSRNLLVHRGKNPSLNLLCNSTSLDQLKSISFALQHKPESFPHDFSARLDNAYVKALSQISKTLDSEIRELKTAARQLLTCLHEFYNQRYLAFSNVDASNKAKN